MIDAAGAIYVIGGAGVTGTGYNDVWASTDKGAKPDSAPSRESRGTTYRWVHERTCRGVRVFRGCSGPLGFTP